MVGHLFEGGAFTWDAGRRGVCSGDDWLKRSLIPVWPLVVLGAGKASALACMV